MGELSNSTLHRIGRSLDEIAVLLRSSGNGSESSLRADAQFALLEHSNLWVDSLAVDSNGLLSVEGWVLGSQPGMFRINGQEAESVNRRDDGQDLAKAFPDLPASATTNARFSLKHNLHLRSDGLLRIEYCTPRPDIRSQDNAWFYVRDEKYPLPSDTNFGRVIVGDEFSYRIGGATTAFRLDNYLRRMTGKGLTDARPVLDWGCGCARVLRHITSANPKIHGGDVDPVNVEWCQTNIPGIDFRHLPLLPRTGYDDNYFDVVFGISVMTHLREDAQDQWLRELSRITRQGGYAMLSVMGEITQMMGGLSEPMMKRAFEKGFFITDERNDQVLADIQGEAYYINVTHSPWYIMDRWQSASAWRVVDIAKGLTVNQDIILLRNEK